MNLPNKLTMIRLFSVPVLIIVMLLPESVLSFDIVCIISAVLFIAASITDSLDGNIARKYNLITDFGKFADPLADKFMVIGALFGILYRFEELRFWFLLLTMIIVFRELAVTAARLVASTSGNIVIAANILGKLKTVFQIICISSVLIEHVLWADKFDFLYGYPLTMITLAITAVLTVWSGIIYIMQCWKYINPQK